MDIVLTGTGSPIPDPNRAGPSTLVKVGELEHILIDAGRGVVMRMAGAGSIPPLLSGVLVTHLHSDHLTDLNDVITTHWVMSPGPRELKIVGPPGIARFVELTLAALEPDMGYRIAHHDDLDYRPAVAVTEVEPGDAFELGSASVSVFETIHAPVHPTVGFQVCSVHSMRLIVVMSSLLRPWRVRQADLTFEQCPSPLPGSRNPLAV